MNSLNGTRPGLTDNEHKAMDLTANLVTVLAGITGHGTSRANDLGELLIHVHAIQNAILAQAAARTYPNRYRLLGETVGKQ